MKTKKIAIVAMMACIAALCFVLVGCGNNNKANFVGEWTLDSMEASGMSMSGDDLAKMGLEVTMSVKDDGKGSLNVMGEAQNFTWEAKSATEMSVKSEDTSPSTFVLADGKLTGESGDNKLVFKKKTSA